MSNQTSNLVAAARELLRLKDLSFDAERINTSGSWEAVHQRDAMWAEYRDKIGGAWDAFRRALQDETPATHVWQCCGGLYGPARDACPICKTPRGNKRLATAGELTYLRDVARKALDHESPLESQLIAAWLLETICAELLGRRSARETTPAASNERVCEDELNLIVEHEQPYGIRDRHGYLAFFPRVHHFDGQDERYRNEVAQRFRMANFLMRALGSFHETNGDARLTAEYWKAEHLAGNAEIDRLQGELREARLEIARVAAEGLRTIGKSIETAARPEPPETDERYNVSDSLLEILIDTERNRDVIEALRELQVRRPAVKTSPDVPQSSNQQGQIDLAWKTFLSNSTVDRSNWEAFVAAWHAGRAARGQDETKAPTDCPCCGKPISVHDNHEQLRAALKTSPDVPQSSKDDLAERLRGMARGYSTENGRDALLAAARIVDGSRVETSTAPGKFGPSFNDYSLEKRAAQKAEASPSSCICRYAHPSDPMCTYVPSTFPAHICRHGKADRTCPECFNAVSDERSGATSVWIWRDSHHYPRVAFTKPERIHPSVEYVLPPQPQSVGGEPGEQSDPQHTAGRKSARQIDADALSAIGERQS